MVRTSDSLSPGGKASLRSGKSLKQAPGIRRRPSSGIPYATNSLGRPKKKGKRKKLTDGQLKKRVWKQFSIFIRTREADSDGLVKCTTCDTIDHWKKLQAGHFIRGRLNANLFEERGCNVQCYSCNVGKQGEVVIYYKWMLARHGQAVIDELIQQNGRTKKWAPGELAALLGHYKALNAANALLAESR